MHNPPEGEALTVPYERATVNAVSVPPAVQLRDPVLKALDALGGEATNADVQHALASMLRLSEDDLGVPHGSKKGSRTEIAYRLAWARTRLKNDGLIERVRPETWRLTEKGWARLRALAELAANEQAGTTTQPSG